MTLKDRLKKLRLASIKPATPEARRDKIQKTKRKDVSKKSTQSRLEQEKDYINTGKPIRPTGDDAKITTANKRKLAKIKSAGVREDRIQKLMDYNRSSNASDRMTDDEFDANERYVNTGEKIRPTGSKINPKLKKKLAKLKEQKIAKEHGHAIVVKSHERGVYRQASLEGQQGKYAKYWLLNAKQTNGNGWGIASHTAKENMQKFIGRPLVVTSSKWHGASVYGEAYEHPFIPTDDLNQIFAHQEQFRVGNIVEVGEKNGDYYATIEMLPKFASYSLPPFCSPAIYQLDAQEHEGSISKWEALHLAALDENPAYGARIALLKGTCVGTAQSCSVQFKSAKQKSAIVRSPDKYKVPREMKHTRVDSSGPLINKVPFGEEDRDTTQQYVDRQMRESSYELSKGKKVRPKKPTQKDRKRIITAKEESNIICPEKKKKLKERLASLGEQNMTYQDSKKVKIRKKKHPEVRKAQKSIEDILRKSGRSVDGSHAQSTFLSTKGDFIGDPNANSHASQIRRILNDPKLDTIDPDIVTTDFAAKHGLPRVQNFPINRAGEKRMSFGIHSKINKDQLRAIKDIEAGGQEVGFAVGPNGTTAVTGTGTRDMLKALREHKLL